MNRRQLFTMVGGGMAATLGLKAAIVEPRPVSMDGGDFQRGTRFFHPDPSVVGVYAIEMYPRTMKDRAEVSEALAVLKKHGAPVYSVDFQNCFPVYSTVTGAPMASTICYFVLPNDNKGAA